MGFRGGYDAFDDFQRRHRVLGFALAVRQKYSDDQGGYLAATITYYGFFSIFPLLLVAATVLGFVLSAHSALRRSIVHSALGQFPLIGSELQVRTLHGSVLALAVGIVLSLWSGMGVFLAAENAMNHLWGVPFRRRPDFVRSRIRALGLLLVLGGGVLGTTVLSSAGTVGASYGIAWKIAAIAISTAIDIGLFWLAMRLLTAHDVSWSCLRGGAIAAGIGWQALQALGGWYVGHELRHASSLYGTFAGVIGLLSFVYLSAHITLLCAEGNVVATRRLWPRSFSVVLEQPATRGDERALAQRAKVEERRSDQRVEVAFRDDDA
ncbi:MAG: YihY/virulence factor BrkB family protein [Actinobacteria bacterium]|nr:YihY/virulence factor BrkB family protein [Actinomycetota bacterium]